MPEPQFLPPLSTGEPHGARRLFEVSVANLAVIRAPLSAQLIGLGFLLVADACAIWGPAAVRQKDVTAKCLFFFVTAALIPFIWKSWKRYKQLRDDPRVLAVFDTGVWLREQDIFLPFERITAIEVNGSDGLRKIYFRFTLDRQEGPPAPEDNSYVSRLRRASGEGHIALPGQDGAFNLPHADLARQVHALAAARAATPPAITIEDLAGASSGRPAGMKKPPA